MTERIVSVASASGLHARPAGLFSKAAAGAGVPITIASEKGAPVNAASLLAVMTLGVGSGERVVLGAPDGPEGERALDDLEALLARDLDA
jgi:phosphocarrier protein